MISVVIATLNDERRLAETLSALIPAAVDGLVHQVVLADGGSADATLEIAEDAGALIVKGPLSAGIAAAGEPWILVLDAGARLTPGWEPVAYAHIQTAADKAGWIAPARPQGLVGWMLALGGETVVGLLAPKAMLAPPHDTVNELARAIGRGRMARLDFAAVCGA
jgi:glycosyltransferase involved in cell wall biosynthesis